MEIEYYINRIKYKVITEDTFYIPSNIPVSNNKIKLSKLKRLLTELGVTRVRSVKGYKGGFLGFYLKGNKLLHLKMVNESIALIPVCNKYNEEITIIRDKKDTLSDNYLKEALKTQAISTSSRKIVLYKNPKEFYQVYNLASSNGTIYISIKETNKFKRIIK